MVFEHLKQLWMGILLYIHIGTTTEARFPFPAGILRILHESSGFLPFPLLWHFFHRNQDSCSAVTFFYPLRNPVCTGPTYVAVGSYVGLEKEQS